MKKKKKKAGEYGEKQKVKKAKKLTQEQEDILGLARQVLRLDEQVKLLLGRQNTLGETVQSVRVLQDKLRSLKEALE